MQICSTLHHIVNSYIVWLHLFYSTGLKPQNMEIKIGIRRASLILEHTLSHAYLFVSLCLLELLCPMKYDAKPKLNDLSFHITNKTNIICRIYNMLSHKCTCTYTHRDRDRNEMNSAAMEYYEMYKQTINISLL